MFDTDDNGRPSRRKFLAAAGGLAVTTATAGCTEFFTGDAAEFEASPARVRQSALDETGYEFDENDEVVIEEEFEAGGETRDVIVTNILTEYQKSIEMGPLGEQEAAIFSVLTSPQVSVLGQEFNPINDMDAEEIAEMIQDQYDEVENLRAQDDSDVTINEQTTTQTRFRADAAFQGNAVDLILHVSEAVELGEDFVVTVGGYPELGPDESDNIITLMENVEPDE